MRARLVGDASALQGADGVTAHAHPEFVPGCFRCDLSRDEQHVLARQCPWCADLYAAHSLEGLAECVEAIAGEDA